MSGASSETSSEQQTEPLESSEARAAVRTRAILSVGAGGALALLLWQLLFRGWAHSFDTMMYARGLWGIARGDLFNPVAERQTFSVHAHLTSAALAPFTLVMPAAMVLVLAQAAAFGATMWLTIAGFQRHAARSGAEAGATVRVGVWAAGLALTSPWVTNAFLFDARPDLLAVPLCLAGLLRLRERRAFDARAVVCLALGVLSREEFALPVAAAALVAPLRGSTVAVWRTRAIAAAIPLLYWSAYWLVGRRWLGGEVAVGGAAASSIILDASQNADRSWRLAALYRAELAATFAATAGALVWRQWRWLAVAAPGLALALANQRMPAHALNLHYSMFAIPGLLVAALSGFEAATSDRPMSRALVLRGAIVGLLSYAAASAAPGGGRFRPQNFSFGAPLWRSDIAEAATPERVVTAHAALSALPRDQGLAVPYPIGAPYVDRSMIVTIDQVNERIARAPALTWAALYARSWGRRGRYLVEHASFRPAGLAGADLAILRRGDPRVPEAVTRPLQAATTCAHPLGAWPRAGLAACAVDPAPHRKPALAVARVGPPDGSLGHEPLQLWLIPGSGAPIELLALQGMLNPMHLAEQPVRFVAAEPAPPGRWTVALTRGGRPLTARIDGDDRAIHPSVPVQWPAWAAAPR